MTAQDHKKLIGVLYLVYGAIEIVAVILVLVGVLTYLITGSSGNYGAPFFIGFTVGILIAVGAFVVPAIIAGYGLFKLRSWGRTAGIVAAICLLLSIPFGTALGIYALWFFFSEEGKKAHVG